MQRPEMRQLKQRIIASYHLGPLDEAETQAYVEHRLRHVGWRDDPVVEPGAYRGIHAHCAGVPRRINTLCDRLLLATFLAERHTVGEADVEEVAGELASEIGAGEASGAPQGAFATHQAAATPAQPTHAASAQGASTHSDDGSPLGLERVRPQPAPGSLPGTAAQLLHPNEHDRLSHLEDRVSLLEASTSMTYGMLRKVLRVLRASQPADRGPG
jgi:hypothetical protein